MSDLAAVSLILGCLWVPLLYFGVRRSDWLSIGVVCWVWAANGLIGAGEVTVGRLLSVPWVLVVVTMLIQRMDRDPEHVVKLAMVQVEQARKMAHRDINEAAAKFARELGKEKEKLRALEEQLGSE